MSVRPVRTRRDLSAFIDLPYRLFERDPVWVPPLRMDIAITLDRRKNPFFEHAEAEYFLAERGGEVVGRIAAIENRLHNEFHHDRVGFFGWFECIRDQAVADALLGTVATWLRARNLTVMRGPASFSTNDQCGLLVDGFETRPTLLMPHNPPWYAELLERWGMVKAKDLLVYQGGVETHHEPVPERLARGTELIQKRQGVTLRALNMKDFPAEVERIKAIYNAAWERNWGFVPMTDHEIDHLATSFKPVVIPDLVPFAEKDGKVIAFGLVLPDLNTALIGNRKGRLLPFLLKTFWLIKTRRLRRCRIVLLGILPEWRGKGVDAMLYNWIWTHSGQNHKIYWGEAGWILEDNAAMNTSLEKMRFSVYKTYRLYDRAI